MRAREVAASLAPAHSPTRSATTDNLPPGVLYRVKATYKYNREDTDELSFDVGEIIRVVEYDDPEEQFWIFKFWAVDESLKKMEE
ncbi:hypothetical protein C0J52_17166 [Blattella germanica]|nr:hypothetical protein C0J52_17166 [Blattella germanica]